MNLTSFYNVTNGTGLSGVLTYANVESSGYLFSVGLLVFFLISVLALKKWGFVEGLTVSAWVWFVPGAILAMAEYVSIMFPLAFLIIAAFGSLYIWAENRPQ